MIKTINYLNLTNGLLFEAIYPNTKYIRIQSSLLERKRWDKILADLDYQFLIDIAKNNKINIIDGATHKPKSRALWQGVPWIEYVLNRMWFGKEIKPIVRNNVNCLKYFKKMYDHKISSQTKRKLRYVKKYITDLKEVKINTICYELKKEIPIEKIIK